jgi:acetylornithine deacetylase
MGKNKEYLDDAVRLLCRLIATPRVSREETDAANILQEQMTEWKLRPCREGNNVWAVCPDFDEGKPTLLLNAHIDTVKAVSTWTREPNTPAVEGDRLYGLGANDCGGGLMTLLMTYRRLVDKDNSNNVRAYNVIYLASAEEEVGGNNGVARALTRLPRIDAAVVGEPTGMQPAVAEKGLMVVDGTATGISGHAARNEGVNAIYEALDDLLWLRDYRFENISPLLGPTKMTVTVVQSGTQHNVVPDSLHFVLDVRTNELYRNEDVLHFLQQNMRKCRLTARSLRLHSSAIAASHPLVERCVELGMRPFGSPTLSDQALMPFPSLKLGPGQSSRSHSANEYICISEMQHALETYERLFTPELRLPLYTAADGHRS